MMVQGIKTISFGQSPAREVKALAGEAKEKRQELIDATIGVGGATAIATGTKVVRTVNSTATKSGRIISKVSSNAQKFKAAFMGMFEQAKNTKFLKPIAKLAENKLARGIAGVFGGASAVVVCITDFSNMINVSSNLVETGKIGRRKN